MDVLEKLEELLKPYVSGLACEQESGSCELTDCRSCNALYAARKLIANGVTVQEWISVKDRLPEYGQLVIVYSGGVLSPQVFAQRFWREDFNEWVHITHWMPLPQPRKENDYEKTLWKLCKLCLG